MREPYNCTAVSTRVNHISSTDRLSSLMFSLLLSESVTKLYNRFICHGWHVNDMFVNSNKNNYQSSTPVILNLLGDVFVDVFMCYVDVC